MNFINYIKQKQAATVIAVNPMLNEYHVGIRSAKDVKTYHEAIKDAEEEGSLGVWPDWIASDAYSALKAGKIIVYSSYPIKIGVFVTPSYMQANEYAGHAEVYSKTVALEEVAWLSDEQGEYCGQIR